MTPSERIRIAVEALAPFAEVARIVRNSIMLDRASTVDRVGHIADAAADAIIAPAQRSARGEGAADG